MKVHIRDLLANIFCLEFLVSKLCIILLSSFQHSTMVRPQFTPQQRAFIVSEYHRNNNNLNRVLQRFREEYPNTRFPCRATVYKNVRKYSVSGTSCNLNKGRSGHRRTARRVANLEPFQNCLLFFYTPCIYLCM